MSGFWTAWLRWWCWVVIAFGAVLISGAFDATDSAVRALLALLGGGSAPMTPALHFSVALMGCVTLGWGLTLLAAIRAAVMLGAAAGPVWRGITVSVIGWFAIDSSVSIATGFGLNAVSNAVLLAAYLLPVMVSGVLATAEAAPAR